MCGIVGFIGKEKKSNEVLIGGLKNLEYRGYDSAGIALAENNSVEIFKSRGKVSNLEEKLESKHVESSTLGIAHTRWATHGVPNQTNSHPHHSGHVTLVHNGIIENYVELKQELVANGYSFDSDTDSEIAAAYIDFCYKNTNNKLEALKKADKDFRGSFAFGIIFDDELDTLYAMRRNSPLIVACGENENFIASDVPAILKYTRDYILLDQDQIAILKSDSIEVFDNEGNKINYEIKKATMDLSEIQKGGYDHFMLKEIHEEPKVVEETIRNYIQNDIKDLINSMPDMSKYDDIQIVACGSAMYAGMIAKSLIETYARVRVEVEVASEFRYKNPILKPSTLVILVSQSGETADTLAALELAKEQNVDTLAVVNVVGSSIARAAKYVCYTLAGPEIAVATTKAYCTQAALLSLIALNVAYVNNKIEDAEIKTILDEIERLPKIMKALLKDDQYIEAGKIISRHSDVYFLGRGIDYALSMEGSLKLKEISYIHSEAYAAGELKHGTISLIEDGTPVIAICTDENLYEKTISNIKEVKARGANVILFVREDLKVSKDFYDYQILLPKMDPFLQAIVTVMPLQLLSYQVANLRGCEIDQPRNLAKSVTVE